MKDQSLTSIIDFIYETGILSRTLLFGFVVFSLHPDHWWLPNVNDPWFIDRKEEDRKWKR